MKKFLLLMLLAPAALSAAADSGADASVVVRKDSAFVEKHRFLPTAKRIDRRIDRALKNSKSGDKKFFQEADFLKAIKAHLESGKPVRSMDLTEEERAQVHELFLLTDKPVIYVANIAEHEIGQSLPAVDALYAAAAAEGAGAITICARTEEEIVQLSPEEKAEFLEALGIGESGLDRLVKAGYSLLGLISYLTAGPKEVRAWTIEKGTKAPQAAGKIHTDFEKGFIRAEIVPYDTLVELGSMAACKEKGLVRSEGKEYVMQDGDVVLFRFNV